MTDQHLKKDDKDYWLCPLCGRALIYDSDPRRLYCDTYNDVYPGRRWGHYDHHVNALNEITYAALIPPFYITWNTTSHHLRVQQLIGDPEHPNDAKDILEQPDTPYEDVLKMYARLKNLKVFS